MPTRATRKEMPPPKWVPRPGWLSKNGLKLRQDFSINRELYFLLIPVILYFLLFHYQPMYGAQIAFKRFSPARGVWDSPWTGIKNFVDFFNSYYFWTLLQNTFMINVYDVLFGFPAPIIFALLLNEVFNRTFKRTVQTITYLPHFISIVVVAGLLIDFMSLNGLINGILASLGGKRTPFLLKPEYFRTIYVASGIWQQFGWGSIIYLAAMSAIDPQLYEAATMDGVGRFKKVLYITLPGIAPTIIILLILRMGQMLSVGSEKILLLYNPITYETADVISTFVYRKGLLEMSYSYSAAVGLFNSVVNFSLLVVVNKMSRKLTETSLW
jgi:putative aldouronate transport system permease protein